MNPCFLQRACHASIIRFCVLIMPFHRIVPLILLALSSLWFAACEPAASSSPQQAAVIAGPDSYFPMKVNDTTLHLQVALSQSEQARGLMFRESLDKDHGMIFVFKEAGSRAFWMRNTPIRLDLAYIDPSGKILEVRKLYPYSETTVPSRSDAVQFVIEMNRGWFDANNLGPGSQLDLTTVANAITARGQTPADFGL